MEQAELDGLQSRMWAAAERHHQAHAEMMRLLEGRPVDWAAYDALKGRQSQDWRLICAIQYQLQQARARHDLRVPR